MYNRNLVCLTTLKHKWQELIKLFFDKGKFKNSKCRFGFIKSYKELKTLKIVLKAED